LDIRCAAIDPAHEGESFVAGRHLLGGPMQLLQILVSRAALLTSIATVFAAGSISFAAATETDDMQQGDGVTPFNPTYVAPVGDLLLGLTPTTITPDETNFDLEISGGTPVLTDGIYGPIFTGVTGGHPSFATAGGSGGTSLTYTLAAPVTLNSVVTLGGWNDSGRDTQSYTVSYGIGGVFTPLATVNYDPTPGSSALETASQVTLDGFSIPNVDSLKFDFASAENGYQGYAELSATAGAATPEPSIGALALVGGLLMTRRRKTA
jgi:hypothetical protein